MPKPVAPAVARGLPAPMIATFNGEEAGVLMGDSVTPVA